MADAGEGKLEITWVDMTDEEGPDAANKLGVEEFTFGAVEGDEFRQTKGYMSLAIEMADETPTVLNRLHEAKGRARVPDHRGHPEAFSPDATVVALVIDGMVSRDYGQLRELLRAATARDCARAPHWMSRLPKTWTFLCLWRPAA